MPDSRCPSIIFMHRLLTAAGLVLLLSAAPAAGQAQARMDAPLRFLASRAAAPLAAEPGPASRAEGARPGAASPGAAAAAVPPFLAAAAVETAGPGGRAYVHALVRVEAGGVAVLRAAGARMGARVGDIVSALVPVDALGALGRTPGIRFMEAAARLAPAAPATAAGLSAAARGGERVAPGPSRPVAAGAPGGPPGPAAPARAALVTGDVVGTDEVGVGDVDADALRQREGSRFLGLAGQGVVVGIYDSGVDLAHEDFRDGAGATRVLYAWDQTGSGAAPGAVGGDVFDYGEECSSALIDAGGCALVDRVGHGTHVAGIAAGDGAATGNGEPAYRFAGVAPAADLIVVKGGDGAFTTDRLLDGLAYIFDRAAALGEPAVVNLSLGTQLGPHDGTTLFEQAIDQLVGAGRIVVTVAGNQAVNGNESPAFVRAPVHAAGALAPGGSATTHLVVPSYTPGSGAVDDGAVLDLWYGGADSVTIRVTTPAGYSVAVAMGDTAIVATPDGAIAIDNASGGRDPNDGDREALITVFDEDAAQPPVPGAWSITLDGAHIADGGAWHMWLVGSTLATATELTSLDPSDNRTLVSSPGSATRAITVAAFASRETWTAAAGPQTFPYREPLGDIGFFSDPGPRRDGVLKPEIAAPGKVVVSSMSRDATLWAKLPNFVEADGRHAVLFGTSMAAPFVTGAVALLLELRPALTPEAARTLLTGAAAEDAFTRHPYTGEPEGTPNAQWGYGKLDVAAAVHALGPPPGSLAMDVAALAAPPATSTRAGTLVPLLAVHLVADSAEAQAVTRLGFDVTGRDSAAVALLVRDLNGDGVPGPDEPVDAEVAARLAGVGRVTFAPAVVVPAGEARDELLTLRLSGASPNATHFAARYLPEETRSEGTLSGAQNRRTGAAGPVASADRAASLLEPGERVALSENPVRGQRLIINYGVTPRSVGIYTLSGRRVWGAAGSALGEGSVAWTLENERGSAVANGLYLLVVELPDGAVTRKIMVLRP